MIWFIRQSWHYLGCAGGTGRWRARLTFLLGLAHAARSYRAACRADGNGYHPTNHHA